MDSQVLRSLLEDLNPINLEPAFYVEDPLQDIEIRRKHYERLKLLLELLSL